MPNKKRKVPLGKSVTLPESLDDEQAAPTSQDILRADELAQTNEILDALWNAKPFVEKKEGGK